MTGGCTSERSRASVGSGRPTAAPSAPRPPRAAAPRAARRPSSAGAASRRCAPVDGVLVDARRSSRSGARRSSRHTSTAEPPQLHERAATAPRSGSAVAGRSRPRVGARGPTVLNCTRPRAVARSWLGGTLARRSSRHTSTSEPPQLHGQAAPLRAARGHGLAREAQPYSTARDRVRSHAVGWECAAPGISIRGCCWAWWRQRCACCSSRGLCIDHRAAARTAAVGDCLGSSQGERNATESGGAWPAHANEPKANAVHRTLGSINHQTKLTFTRQEADTTQRKGRHGVRVEAPTFDQQLRLRRKKICVPYTIPTAVDATHVPWDVRFLHVGEMPAAFPASHAHFHKARPLD